MVLLLFLMACADPAPVAQQACEALPGLAPDATGLQLLQPLLAEVDYNAMASGWTSEGLRVVGAEGLAELRAQASCTVGLVEGAGQGRWAVELERSLPVVNPDGSFGEVATTALSWQAVKTPDGIRVETGLAGAAIMRASSREAFEEGDLRRYSSTWHAIANKFPDPLITVDIAHADVIFARHEYREKIRGKPVEVDDEAGTLKAELANTGDQAVSKLELRVDFGVGDQTASETATLEALEAGGTAEVVVPIPEGADGKVHIEVLGLQFTPQ
jgi:hypothetical protein